MSGRIVQHNACNKRTKIGLYDLTQNIMFQQHFFQLYPLNRRCSVYITKTFILAAQGEGTSFSLFRSECKSLKISVLKRPEGKSLLIFLTLTGNEMVWDTLYPNKIAGNKHWLTDLAFLHQNYYQNKSWQGFGQVL